MKSRSMIAAAVMCLMWGAYPYRLAAQTSVIYSFPLDSEPGWTMESAWAFGQPTGGGSYSGDPNSGHTGNNVFGYNLAGDYANNLTPTRWLTTNSLNCAQGVNLSLRFWRWLGIESGSYDHAYIEISTDGSAWSTVWQHAGSSLSESTWSHQSYDISTVADNQSTVFLRWGMGPTDYSETYPGWNIDDIEIWGVLIITPTPTSTPFGYQSPFPTPSVMATPSVTPTASPPPADFYVDAVNGSDSTGDGSVSHPFRTIQYAVNQVYANGKTVFIFPGTYEERVVVQQIAGGLKLVGAGPSVATVDASSVYKNGGVIHLPSGYGFVISGLTITGGTYEGSGDYGGAIRGSGSGTSATVEDCLIFDNFAWSGGSGGIYLGNNSIIRRNVFYYNSTTYAPGALVVGPGSLVEWNDFIYNIVDDGEGGAICAWDSSIIIRYNVFTGNHVGWGIHGHSSTGRGGALYGEATVYNNLFVHNSSYSYNDGYGGAAYLTGGSFINNTLVANRGDPEGDCSGLYCYGGVEAYNNIIVNGTDGVGFYVASGSGVTADHNDIWNNDLGSYGGSAVPGAHDIHQNPNFAAESAGDYRLSAGSPGIDAGSNGEVIWSYDLDRNYRIWDGNGDGAAVVDLGAYEYGSAPCVTPTPTPEPVVSAIESGDYDGDGSCDIAVFRRSTSLWSVRNLTRAYFGGSTDQPVPADYNGDGTTDIAIFRESGGLWSVRNVSRFYLGAAGDVPVPGDYLGNGTAEAGLFRASAGLWAIRDLTRAYFGLAGDFAIPGYYSVDDAKDIAVFRGSTGMWSVRDFTRFYFGVATDDLVPGDYDGAGKWEGGIFRGFSGLWSIRNVSRFYLGLFSDAPVPADFNGDGKDDAGIFRDSRGMWALRKLTRAYFGATGDIPVTR